MPGSLYEDAKDLRRGDQALPPLPPGRVVPHRLVQIWACGHIGIKIRLSMIGLACDGEGFSGSHGKRDRCKPSLGFLRSLRFTYSQLCRKVHAYMRAVSTGLSQSNHY
jgi:hypothetical protein